MLRFIVWSFVCLLTATTAQAEMLVQERAQEAGKLKDSQGTAQRVDDAIVLRLANGTVVTRRNEDQCGGDGKPPLYQHCIRYVYLDHFPDHHAFLVGQMFWEDLFYEWIDDRTGEIAHIRCEPHFSPAGGRLIAVCPSEMGYNGIQVWAHKGDKLVLEWEHEPKEYALYTFQEWDGEDVVKLTMTTYVDNKMTENLPARLVRSPEWTIQGPPEKSGLPIP